MGHNFCFNNMCRELKKTENSKKEIELEQERHATEM